MNAANRTKSNKIITTIRKQVNLDHNNNNINMKFGEIKEQKKQLDTKTNNNNNKLKLGGDDGNAKFYLKNLNNDIITKNNKEENHAAVTTPTVLNSSSFNNIDNLQYFPKDISPIPITGTNLIAMTSKPNATLESSLVEPSKQIVSNKLADSVEAPKLSRKEYALFKRRKSSVAVMNENAMDKPMDYGKAKTIKKLFENKENANILDAEDQKAKMRCVCLAEDVVLSTFLVLMCCVWLAALGVSIYYYAIDSSTLVHWKLFGIISSSYFIILTIITAIFSYFIRKQKKPIEQNIDMTVTEVKIERPKVKKKEVNEKKYEQKTDAAPPVVKNPLIAKSEPELSFNEESIEDENKTAVRKLVADPRRQSDNKIYVIKKPPRHYISKSSFKSNQLPFVKVLSDSVINRRAEPPYYAATDIANENPIQYVDPRFVKTSVSAPSVPMIVKKRRKPKRVIVSSGFVDRNNTISGYPSDQGYVMVNNNRVVRAVNDDLMYDDDDDITDPSNYKDSNRRYYYQ